MDGIVGRDATCIIPLATAEDVIRDDHVMQVALVLSRDATVRDLHELIRVAKGVVGRRRRRRGLRGWRRGWRRHGRQRRRRRRWWAGRRRRRRWRQRGRRGWRVRRRARRRAPDGVVGVGETRLAAFRAGAPHARVLINPVRLVVQRAAPLAERKGWSSVAALSSYPPVSAGHGRRRARRRWRPGRPADNLPVGRLAAVGRIAGRYPMAGPVCSIPLLDVGVLTIVRILS